MSKGNYDNFQFPSMFDDVVDKKDGYSTAIHKITIHVVGEYLTPSTLNSVQYSPEFVSRLPLICHESRRAQKDGTLKLNPTAPGIPTSKFAENDQWTAGQEWQIQSVYEVKDKPDSMQILYEGWSSKGMGIESVDELNRSYVYDNFKIRSKYLEVLKQNDYAQKGQQIDNYRFLSTELIQNPEHPFWRFEDLSYYHSLLQNEQGMAPIFYMCLDEKPVSPPTSAYTNSVIMTPEVFIHCLAQQANKSFVELLSERVLEAGSSTGPCEHPRNCKCDQTKNLLYPPSTISLVPDSEGRIDFNKIDAENPSVIIVECSDVCGCSASCPRRQLQGGQHKPLVINYEGDGIGMGVRTPVDIPAGEFICEYTGEMALVKHVEGISNSDKEAATRKRLADDTTYDMRFTTMDNSVFISAKHAGNVARYLNHSCDGNATFIETHARITEAEPLIPRVAVYAIEDIKAGEKITISSRKSQVYRKNSRWACKCAKCAVASSSAQVKTT